MIAGGLFYGINTDFAELCSLALLEMMRAEKILQKKKISNGVDKAARVVL